MNKTVLITGASRGIGKACAIEFAKNSCNLVISCKNNIEKLENVKKECEAFGVKCITFVGDMGNNTDVSNMFKTAFAEYKNIDILVNNAGISIVGLFQDMSPEQWSLILNSNLTSVYNCCHEVLPSMIRNQSGRIINISSVWGNAGASCEAAYSATKGAINALTKALGKELAPSHIAVNAIACGAIDTDMNSCFSKEDLAALADEIPAGRMGTPEEAAKLVYDIANTASYLTGQIITLDGGWI